MKKVIVIGGGPSGLMAAIAAARAGAQTTVLEAGAKPGRKLLLTGNGRCNLTNLDAHIDSVYDSSDPDFARSLVRSVFSQFGVQDTLDFFRQEGLLTSVEHKTYVYPVTGQSASVLEILLRALEALKVKMKYCEEVIEIERREPAPGSEEAGCLWNVRTKTWNYEADSVILSCGSRAVPSTGSNGSGYELSRMLGLDVTDVLPGLTAVSCRLSSPEARAYVPGSRNRTEPSPDRKNAEDSFIAAAGTRTTAVVSVLSDGEVIAQERGQIQFTQQDLSGVVVFNLSRKVVRALHQGHDVSLSLDLIPDYTQEEIEAMIRSMREKFDGISDEKILCGLVPSRMIPVVITLCALTGDSLAYVIKHFSLKASRLRNFDSAQVCVGGVRTTELNPDTLECVSEELKGIFLTGELIDIDGPCGGYNLQWAWSSGYTAGHHAAQ